MREAEQVGETGTRDDAVVIHAAEALAEIGDERQLARRARGKIRVAAFGGGGHETAIDVVKQRFAEARAGRDERGVASRRRDAFLQRCQFIGFEYGDRVRHRFEVVQERDGAAQSFAHRRRVGDPRDVDHARDQSVDGACHAEGSRANTGRARFFEKCADQIIETVEVERGIFAHDPRFRARVAMGEYADQCLCTANVGRQPHARMILSRRERARASVFSPDRDCVVRAHRSVRRHGTADASDAGRAAPVYFTGYARHDPRRRHRPRCCRRVHARIQCHRCTWAPIPARLRVGARNIAVTHVDDDGTLSGGPRRSRERPIPVRRASGRCRTTAAGRLSNSRVRIVIRAGATFRPRARL